MPIGAWLTDNLYTLCKFYQINNNIILHHYNGTAIEQYSRRKERQTLFDKDNIQHFKLPDNTTVITAYHVGSMVTLERQEEETEDQINTIVPLTLTDTINTDYWMELCNRNEVTITTDCLVASKKGCFDAVLYIDKEEIQLQGTCNVT
eukprot:8120654-Ditylum_brightwellii.AAC.1